MVLMEGMISRLDEALFDRSSILSKRLHVFSISVVVDLITAGKDRTPFDHIRNVVFVLVLHIVVQISFELVEGSGALIGPLSERLRKTPVFSFLLNHLQQVCYHLVLVSQLRRQVVVCHRLQVGDLVTWMVQREVLIHPYLNFIIGRDSDQLAVDVERTEFFINLLKRISSLPQNMKAFWEGQLRQVTESMLDTLRIHVESSGLCTFAYV